MLRWLHRTEGNSESDGLNERMDPQLIIPFPGNTSDRRQTIEEVVEDIHRRFGVKHVTLVADKGMVKGANLRFLVEGEMDFILGESARQSKIA